MKTVLLLAAVCASMLCSAQGDTAIRNERLKIASEMQWSLESETLAKWYPQCVDRLYGGYLSTYTYDFKPTGPQDKFIVTQARHTWTTAKAAQLYPDKKYYLAAARHGYLFLRDKMWDKQYGGFYNLVDRKGTVKNTGKAAKEAYGNAFAIYALAAYYKASGDTGALALAKRGFLWLERGSHDPQYGGYFQHLTRAGKPVQRDASVPSTSDLGYKDQNSSIHLLEAFAELYEAWPDALLRKRLEEMLYLIRDTITTQKGTLTLFLERNWKPVSFQDSSEAVVRKHKSLDHVSFGHDVETAYLMLEASHALGIHDDSVTLMKGKKMVDHALQTGWDAALGGFYNEGYYFKGRDTITILNDGKNWWTQVEGMNTLLLLADRFPNDTMQYFNKFKLLWRYCQNYLIDHQFGDWYEEGIDKDPKRKTALKGHIWKGTYHHFRSLVNCIKALKSPLSTGGGT